MLGDFYFGGGALVGGFWRGAYGGQAIYGLPLIDEFIEEDTKWLLLALLLKKSMNNLDYFLPDLPDKLPDAPNVQIRYGNF